MAKIKYQNITQIEFDTETQKSRLIKAFTKVLGQGNGQKYKKKQVQAEANDIEEGEM